MAVEPGKWLGAGRVLKASKQSVIKIVPDGEEMSFYSSSVESIVPKNLIKTDELSISWSVSPHDEPEVCRLGYLPAIAKFKSINNVVVVALKQTPMRTYMWGIPVETLIAWRPPQKAGDAIAEDGVLCQFELPHPDLDAFTAVENTATHALKSLLDKFLSHCPTFKAAKIRSIAQLVSHSEAGFVPCMKKALLAGEDLDRKAAAQKGKSSRDKNESGGGGAEAKEKWASIEKLLLESPETTCTLPFNRRYLELHVDKTTFQLTAESIHSVKGTLKYAILPSRLPSHLPSRLPSHLPSHLAIHTSQCRDHPHERELLGRCVSSTSMYMIV